MKTDKNNWAAEKFKEMDAKIHPTLQDVHSVYKKWLYMEDTNRIDVVLAVALTQKLAGIPLWLILVSPSGDWKSEQINALYSPEICIKLDKLTSKTLISGNPKVPDLAPALRDKLVLFSDFASMLKAHPQEKTEIFAQLRELYDGRAGGAFGTGKKTHYEGIRTTWIIGSTPAIYRQILVHQDLGTRELLYMPKGNVDTYKLIEKIVLNSKEGVSELMREELREITVSFLKHIEYKEIDLSSEEINAINLISNYLTLMRGNITADSYTGDLIADVDIEKNTRVFKQMLILYQAIRSLKEDYPMETALEILIEVAMSSGGKHRIPLVQLLLNNVGCGLSTKYIAEQLRLGRKTVHTELAGLWNMGLVKREVITEDSNPWKETHSWELETKSPLVGMLIELEQLKKMYAIHPEIGEKTTYHPRVNI